MLRIAFAHRLMRALGKRKMKKTSFHIFVFVVLIIAMFFGALSGEAVVNAFLTDCCISTPPLQTAGVAVLSFLSFLVGFLLSVGGCVFLIILPAAFAFPNASKPFSWQSNPAWASRVLAWYSNGMAKYAESIKHEA